VLFHRLDAELPQVMFIHVQTISTRPWRRINPQEPCSASSVRSSVELLRLDAARRGQTITARDAPDLLDVDQAAGSAAHSVPRAMAGWLGCFLPPSQAGSSHSVLLAVARP